jgi:hypothetical protein
MVRKTSDWPIAESLPGLFLGRDSVIGNQLIPTTLILKYVQSIIAQTASNAGGAVNFRGIWDTTGNTSYAPNDLVSYGNKIYLLIASQVYMSSTTPDQDASNWLCLFGQMVNVVDMNAAPNQAFFYSAGAANTPPANGYGFGFTLYHGTGFAVQLFWSSDGYTQYVRALNSNVWSAWVTQAAAFINTATPGGEGTGTIWAAVANNGEYVSVITVDTVLNLAGWVTDVGKVQRCRWEIVNGGAFATTWGPYNNVKWVKPDGTITTDFTTLGVTWNAADSNFFEFWTRDGGKTVYARPLR